MTAFIELRGAVGGRVLVDECDVPRLAGYKWYRDNHGYAVATASTRRNGKFGQRKIKMHRLIIDARDGVPVDHVNGCKLDNRRSNLRACTLQQNQWNCRPRAVATSRFKGVSRRHDGKKWVAMIKIDGVQTYLGSFESEALAAAAYDSAATKHFGKFAMTNARLISDVEDGR